MDSVSENTPKDQRTGEPAGVGIRQEQLDGGATLFTIEGELDLACAERVREALATCVREGPSALVVDLSRCSFMDSSGLRALIEAKRALGDGEVAPKLLLAAPAAQPRRILELTSIETVMPIFSTREEAEEAARR